MLSEVVHDGLHHRAGVRSEVRSNVVGRHEALVLTGRWVGHGLEAEPQHVGLLLRHQPAERHRPLTVHRGIDHTPGSSEAGREREEHIAMAVDELADNRTAAAVEHSQHPQGDNPAQPVLTTAAMPLVVEQHNE